MRPPPLYQAEEGTRERDLKSEQAMEDFLVSVAVDEVKVYGAGGATPLEGDKLAKFIHHMHRFVKVLEKIERRADGRIVDALVQAADLSKADLADQKRLQAALDKIVPYLAARYEDLAQVKFELVPDAEHGGFQLRCPTRLGGARKTTVIDFEFLDTPEYEELRKTRGELAAMAKGPYILERGGEKQEFLLLGALSKEIEEIGRKGLQIQRYKGLGEMNAEQLWETTMDPEKRTLLQVTVLDAPEAEKIFSTLMGDLVEPRRDFIEKNALNVRNLDV